jgi:hypothetical protein
VKVASNDRDEIHFAVTDAHPRVQPVNNVYHFYYKNGGFYRSDATFIKSAEQLPLTTEDLTLVYDARKHKAKAWTWDIALDAATRPVITYAAFPSNTEHRYRYARWDGTRWLDHEVTAAGGSIVTDVREPNYSGGIVLDGKDPNTVFLSRQTDSGFRVEKWVTRDNGGSWSSRAISSGAGKNVRPFVPRHHADGAMEVIWMNGSYPFYLTYDTSLQAYPN